MKKLFIFGIVFLILIATAVLVRSANFYTTQVVHVTPYLSAHVINDSSVVGYWRFEKPSNNTFTNDFIGLNNGTVSNSNWTEQGRVGAAYGFIATNGKIDVPHAQRFNFSGVNENFSIEAWFRVSASSRRQSIVTKFFQNLSVSPTVEHGILIDILVNGSARFVTETGSSDYMLRDSRSNVSNGDWHHIVGVRNGTDLQLYVDGSLNQNALLTVGSTTRSLANVSANITIGFIWNLSSNYGTNFFNGTIDEVMIFNRTLSAQEIQNYYQEGSASRLLKEAEKHAQFITNRNEVIVVVISKKIYDELTTPKTSLLNFFKNAPLPEVDIAITRSQEIPREIDL